MCSATARRGLTGLIEAPAGSSDARRESFIHIHIDRLDTADAHDRLTAGLTRVYADVRAAVSDWSAMHVRVEAAVAAYRADPPPLRADEIAEAVLFLKWLASDHFTFLGVREHRLAGSHEQATLEAVTGSGLGVLRDPAVQVLRRGRELVQVTPEVLEFLREPQALIITKANVKSRVHRRAHLDYIGVKLFTREGVLEGELRIVGLFTLSSYTQSPQTIPYLRHKVARVLQQAALDAASHSGKTLVNVLDTYPRDDLLSDRCRDAGRFRQ